MADNFSNNKRIAKNTILLGIRQLFVLCIALYVSRVTLKVLGINDFGIYNVVCGFVSMFTFLNAAMTTAIQRFYNYELGLNGENGANKVFVISLYAQAVLALVIIMLLESVGLWYMYKVMVIPAERFNAAMWIFQISIISTFVLMLKVPYDAAILAHEKMDYYAFLSILNQILKLIIVLSLPYIGYDHLVMYGLLFLMVTIIDFLLNYIYTRIKFNETRFKWIFDKKMFKDILAFSGWNIFGKFAYVMREQGLNMVLNMFFGPAINAARGLAFQVTGAINGFVSNVGVASKPQLTQSFAQGNLSRTLSLMFSVSKLSYFILLFFALPICLEIDFILDLWLGADSVPEYTNIFILLVVLMSLIGTQMTQISFVVHATGVMKKYQIVTSIVELAIIPVSYICLTISAYPPSVFIIALLIYVVNSYASIKILSEIIKLSIRDYLLKVTLPLLEFSLVCIIIPLLVWFFMDAGWFRVIIVFFVTSISAVVSFYLVGLSKEEKHIVLKFIKK